MWGGGKEYIFTFLFYADTSFLAVSMLNTTIMKARFSSHMLPTVVAELRRPLPYLTRIKTRSFATLKSVLLKKYVRPS